MFIFLFFYFIIFFRFQTKFIPLIFHFLFFILNSLSSVRIFFISAYYFHIYAQTSSTFELKRPNLQQFKVLCIFLIILFFFEVLLFIINKIVFVFFIYNLEFFFFYSFFILLFLLVYQLFRKIDNLNSKLFLLIYLFIFVLGFIISIYTFNIFCIFNDNFFLNILSLFDYSSSNLKSIEFFYKEIYSDNDKPYTPFFLEKIEYKNQSTYLSIFTYFMSLSNDILPYLDYLSDDEFYDYLLNFFYNDDSSINMENFNYIYAAHVFEYLRFHGSLSYEIRGDYCSQRVSFFIEQILLNYSPYLEDNFDYGINIPENFDFSELPKDIIFTAQRIHRLPFVNTFLPKFYDPVLANLVYYPINCQSEIYFSGESLGLSNLFVELIKYYPENELLGIFKYLEEVNLGNKISGLNHIPFEGPTAFNKAFRLDKISSFYTDNAFKIYDFNNRYIIKSEPIVKLFSDVDGLKPNFYLFNSLFIYDPFIYFFKIIFVILSFFLYYIYYVLSIFYKNNNLYEDLLLIFLCICNIFLYISVNDLLVYYLILEVLTLTSYYLAASGKNSISLEAGYKYFILAGFFSSVFLIGICLIYYSIGFISNFDEISYFVSLFDFDLIFTNISIRDIFPFSFIFSLPLFIIVFFITIISFNFQFLFIYTILLGISFNFQLFILLFGICFILIGLFFKLGVAPFHSWVPDVYDGSPLFVTIFFMTLIKLAHFLFLLRFIFVVCLPILKFLQVIFLFFGLFSMFIGSILALAQFKLKRIFAYSSINHIGLILVLLAFSNVNGIEVSLTYLLMYLIMLFLLFFIVSLIILNYSNYSVNRVENYLVLNNLNSSFVGFSFSILLFSITLFSFIGVPPFIGFVIKYLVFFQVLTAGLVIVSHTVKFKYLILFIIIILSIVSTFYYLRLIVKTFVDNNFYFVMLNVKYLNNSGNLMLYIFSFIFLILVIFLGNYLDFLFGLFRWLLYFSHILGF